MSKWLKLKIINWAFKHFFKMHNEKINILRSNILRLCNNEEMLILRDWLNSYNLESEAKNE
jgi:hypothetical protein